MMTKGAAFTPPKPSPVVATCAACSSEIVDRYYLLVAEQYWHIDCLQCCICGVKLERESSCFSRGGLIFCREDYNKQFPRHCLRCQKRISPKEMVMRVKQYVFHMSCFDCAICTNRLQPGDYFGVSNDGVLYCRSHCCLTSPSSLSLPSTSAKIAEMPFLPQQLAGGHQSAGLVPASCVEGVAQFEDMTLLNIDNVQNMGYRRIDGDENSVMGFNGGHYQTDLQATVTPINKGNNEIPTSAPTPCPSTISPTPSTIRLSPRHLMTPSDGPAGPGNHQQQQSMLMMMNNNLGCSSSNSSMSSRSKRMRTSFKHNQLRIMKHYFSLNANPDAKVLKELAQKTGLTKRVLQVWFQNARAKNRRSLQLKQDLISHSCLPLSACSIDSLISPIAKRNNDQSNNSDKIDQSSFHDDDSSCPAMSSTGIHSSNHFDTADNMFIDCVKNMAAATTSTSSIDSSYSMLDTVIQLRQHQHIQDLQIFRENDDTSSKLLINDRDQKLNLNFEMNEDNSNNNQYFTNMENDRRGQLLRKNSTNLPSSMNQTGVVVDDGSPSSNYATLAACLQNLKRSNSPFSDTANDRLMNQVDCDKSATVIGQNREEFYQYN